MTEPSLTNKQLTEKLSAHLSDYEIHKRDYLARQQRQDEAHENNLKAIQALTVATQGLVDAWTVANGIQRFVVWLSKFAVLTTVAIYLSNRFGIKLP
jgi:hypothetical protein